jgi:hypothetical protein
MEVREAVDRVALGKATHQELEGTEVLELRHLSQAHQSLEQVEEVAVVIMLRVELDKRVAAMVEMNLMGQTQL